MILNLKDSWKSKMNSKLGQQKGLTCKSMDEVPVCDDHSNESYRAVFYYGTVSLS